MFDIKCNKQNKKVIAHYLFQRKSNPYVQYYTSKCILLKQA